MRTTFNWRRRVSPATMCLAALALSCTLDKQAAPPLGGPSGLNLSLDLTATPDHLLQDGQTRANVTALARDPNGPVVGLGVLWTVYVSDGSRLEPSVQSSVTDQNGYARMFLTAPAPPLAVPQSDVSITVLATPIQSDIGQTTGRSVTLALVPPSGTPVGARPPAVGPNASITVSPTSPTQLTDVFFDGGGSTVGTGARIVEYSWSFGDGSSETGTSSQATHQYRTPNTYVVRLTVKDNFDRTDSITAEVLVAAPAAAVVPAP
ncbi:MAG: PKD domain-containing protein [Acidobacteriota bacterium]